MAAYMRRAGMVLDVDYTTDLRDRLADEQSEFARRAAEYGVANVNSNAQISEALLAMGETLTERTASGAFKLDKSVLLRMADLSLTWEPLGARVANPLAVAVLRSKRAGKWRTTYADTFLSEVDAYGRIHPDIRTLAARTGRMSVTKPAVQTLPSSDWMIRRAMLADPGHVFVSVDFKAIELRVLAALADVRRMREAIAEGRDLHDFTATLIYGPDFTPKQRKVAKVGGLGTVYGGGAAGLSRQSGVPYAEMRHMMDTYDAVYPEVRRTSNRWQREARQNGMVHISVTGRQLPLDRDRAYAVINYACQSAARDCLGQSLIHMRERGLLPYLKLPIHDEVLASVPAGDAAEISREIEACMTFDLRGVPIEADAEIGGRSWGSLYGADF
jgi:DNA polymerase-1